MRFSITPLGGASVDIDRIVAGIVEYLHPKDRRREPAARTRDRTGPSAYYADSGEEPGRWLGRSAATAGLLGRVDRDDFAKVLAGRDPSTGERLITAQGSAGRRPTLGSGNHTLVDDVGELFYGQADAASVLGVNQRELSRMLDVGVALSLAQLAPGSTPTPTSLTSPDAAPTSTPTSLTSPDAAPTSTPTSRMSPDDTPPTSAPSQPEGSFLVPLVRPDGTRLVSEAELTRCMQAREAGTSPDVIVSVGGIDDLLPISEAARLAGLTGRYLRRAAKYHEDHRDEIEQTLAAGRQPRRAYLPAVRGTRGRWFVTRGELAEFIRRRKPPAVRVGYDITLTTEKSLGVLALLGGQEAARSVLGAIEGGNDWALRWLEDCAASGRVANQSVKADGWTVASFRHLTSRALDPFPHHHNVIANTVALPDGSRRALDARGLYTNARAASALATAEMRHLLSANLGVRWRPGRKGGWEIDGIPDEVLTEFSRRRTEIDEALSELEEAIGRGAHPGEVEDIVLRTRPAKQQTPVAELIEGWHKRAAAHGFDTEAITHCIGNEQPTTEPETAALFASLASPNGICEGGSVFDRNEALAAMANHPVPAAQGLLPLLCGARRLEELTDEFLSCSHVVRLGGGATCLYTTAEMLELQDRVVRRVRKGLHRGLGLVTADILDRALDDHPQLTGEQRSLVTSWCTSGSRYQTAVGRAGAGKTTSVAAAAQAWQAAGYRVIGGAVKGEAARTLADATKIDCETVAWYLAHDDPQQSPFDARTVLVIDEASTLSDRDLDRLMHMTAAAGASLRLIGDPAQHGAIEAGGMFRVLCKHFSRQTPELATTHRLQDPEDRAAADALREGRIDDALDCLQRAGHLHIVDNDLDMYRQVLDRWWNAHLQGLDHPMVDRRNVTRHQLNRLAHRLRQVHGEIGADEIVASGDRRFSVGDRITARAPNRGLHPVGDRHAYVRNGALGTVTAIHRARHRRHDTITADFDGLGNIELPRDFFDHHTTRGGRTEVGIDHAYALTSYAVQGSTSDVSTSRLDATATRAEAYVDITRGRLANHLYLTATTDPLDGEALPRVPPPDADEAVADRLHRSQAELTAWELVQQQASSRQPLDRAVGL